MFREKLAQATARQNSLLCVGIDVDPKLAPLQLVGQKGWVEKFCLGIIEATADLVCAYKPNLAFFEALGLDGYQGLRRTLDGMPKDLVSIGDAKRGDIGSTAIAYARALYEVWGFDVVTVSPLLGPDTLEPFLAYKDRGILVLCKTSNPGSGTYQDLPVPGPGGAMPLYELIARQMAAWDADGAAGQLGLVTGATYPAQLAEIRAAAPDLPFLVPGIGVQQGDIWATVNAGLDARGAGIVVSASRGVTYASQGDDWQQAARDAAIDLRARLEAARAEVRAAKHLAQREVGHATAAAPPAAR